MSERYQAREGAFAWVKQPAYTSGLRVASPATFIASSDGAADGTTIVADYLGGANDASWVGYIVECVRAYNEANRGCLAMVKSFAFASLTLSIDALPAQVKGPTGDYQGDLFRLYATPDAPVIATSAVVGGATVIATGRTESDDYWDGTEEEGGYYLEAVQCDNCSSAQHPLVQDFDGPTDTFTPATSYGVNIAVGDFFRLLKHPEIDGFAIVPTERPDVPRDTLVAGYGAEPSVAGRRGGGGAVTLRHRGAGQSRIGAKSELDEALSCVFTTTAKGADVTVDAGASTTSIPYSAGAPTVGQCYVTEEGDVVVVRAVAGGAITPAVPLRTAPRQGTTLKGGRVYTPSTVLLGALTCYGWKGNSLLEILYGCLPLPTFSAEPGGYHLVAVQLLAADYYQSVLGPAGTAHERGWYSKLSTVDALRGKDIVLALYDGTTRFDPPVLGYSFDPGIEQLEQVNMAAPNDTDGRELINCRGKGTFKTRINSTTRRLLRDFEAKRELRLLIQVGSAPGYPGLAAIYAGSITFDSIPLDPASGEYEAAVPWTVNRSQAELALGMPQSLIALF